MANNYQNTGLGVLGGCFQCICVRKDSYINMSDAAVLIRNAFKQFGNGQKANIVLNNLDMNVQRGSIYGLLGASGCGKTTLLSCIVGRKNLNSGEIWVLGGKPGTPGSGVPGPRIGYMPQDIALVGEFSVKDAVFYFGRMYGMSESRLEERLEDLSELLDLPPSTRRVKHCSGGQQRRISFAAALVHEPELLILDEPTVGLDPVLRESIWTHLVHITTKRNVAVIITTHYIEETRQAHRIGLMRGGQLMAEESPENLMSLFRSDSLEDVFLMLSIRQSKGEPVPEFQSPEYLALKQSRNEAYGSKLSILTADPSQIADSTLSLVKNNISDKAKVYESQSKSLCFSRLKALLNKNVIQMSRNPASFIFATLFPILQTLAFFGAIGADPHGLKLGIVNEESSWQNCLNYTSRYNTVHYYSQNDTCELTLLSCRFIHQMNETIAYKKHYDDLPDALKALRDGALQGVLFFGHNFTSASLQRRNEGRDTTDADVDASEIQIWLDMADRPIGTVLKQHLYDTYFEYIRKLLGDCQDQPRLGEIPVHYMDPVFGKKDEEFTVFMVPGVMVTLIFFLTTSVTSSIIITDRLEGVWDRSLVAGVSTIEIMITHFTTQFLMMVFQVIEIFLLTFWAFGIECSGSYVIAALLLMLQGVAGICNGFLISIVCSTYSAANIAATGLFYIMILLCAIVWPLEGMPIGLRWFSLCLPFTYPILSLRNILVKGWTVTDLKVYTGFLISGVWIAMLCIISFYLLKRRS